MAGAVHIMCNAHDCCANREENGALINRRRDLERPFPQPLTRLLLPRTPACDYARAYGGVGHGAGEREQRQLHRHLQFRHQSSPVPAPVCWWMRASPARRFCAACAYAELTRTPLMPSSSPTSTLTTSAECTCLPKGSKFRCTSRAPRTTPTANSRATAPAIASRLLAGRLSARAALSRLATSR